MLFSSHRSVKGYPGEVSKCLIWLSIAEEVNQESAYSRTDPYILDYAVKSVFIYIKGSSRGITAIKQFPFYHIGDDGYIHIKCPTLASGGKWIKSGRGDDGDIDALCKNRVNVVKGETVVAVNV